MNFTTASLISTFFGSFTEKKRLPLAAVGAGGRALNTKFTMMQVNVCYNVGGDCSLITKMMSHLVLGRISQPWQQCRLCHVS